MISSSCVPNSFGEERRTNVKHIRDLATVCVYISQRVAWASRIYMLYNLAMLAKQGWRLVSSPNSLIARLYKTVYFPDGNLLNVDLGNAPSFSWRTIISARHILQLVCCGRLVRGHRFEIGRIIGS